MGYVFVARSGALSDWGSDVGLGKHLFKLGYAEDSAEAAVKEMAAANHGGVADWTLVRKEQVPDGDETALVDRLARKEKMLEAALYPRLKGATGVFKVKIANVEKHLLMRQALDNQALTAPKPKATDFAAYLITNALR